MHIKNRDELLCFLADSPDNMSPVIELGPSLLDPDFLTVCDADGLIEFGRRNHCYFGTDREPHLEKGWKFRSVTGPGYKSMADYLIELRGFDGDDRIRTHVRLTASGRVEAARLKIERSEYQVKQEFKTTDTDWRDVQRRLLELRNSGEPFTNIRDLAKKIGCSGSTVHKAVKNSAILEGWQARRLDSKGSIRAGSLTDRVTDNVEQTCEVNPAEEAETDDVDTAMAQLIQESEPEERAKLNSLDTVGRRRIVALRRNDQSNCQRLW